MRNQTKQEWFAVKTLNVVAGAVALVSVVSIVAIGPLAVNQKGVEVKPVTSVPSPDVVHPDAGLLLDPAGVRSRHPIPRDPDVAPGEPLSISEHVDVAVKRVDVCQSPDPPSRGDCAAIPVPVPDPVPDGDGVFSGESREASGEVDARPSPSLTPERRGSTSPQAAPRERWQRREWVMIETQPPPASIDPRDYEPMAQPVLKLPAKTKEDGVSQPRVEPVEDAVGAMAVDQIGVIAGKIGPPDSGTSDSSAIGPADISLRQAYESYLLPSLDRRRAPKTTSSYRTSLGHWELFHQCRTGGEGENGSTDSTPVAKSPNQNHPAPPVCQITDRMLNEFGEWLMADETTQRPDGLNVGGLGLSLGTAEKVWKNIRAILRRIGPRESGNPRAAEIIDRVPAMDPLHELRGGASEDDLSDGAADITDDQLDRLYWACEIATWPDESAALQWQTYLVILSMMGPRVNDAATLRTEHFRMDAESPVRRSSRKHRHGWLVYVPAKTSRKKPRRLIVPLPPVVRSHVAALARIRGGKLFAWNSSRTKSFADTWQAIADQAGLPEVERRHVRAVANLRWSSTGVRDDLGNWVLGHMTRDVNETHYTRIEPYLIRAVPKLSVPRSFAQHMADDQLVDGPRQTFLF